MTTTQVRDDLDQTAPEEAPEPVATSEETNGHTEKPKRKYTRKAAAAETNGHELADTPSYLDGIKARALGLVAEISHKIEEREIKVAALHDEIGELLRVKASLTGSAEAPPIQSRSQARRIAAQTGKPTPDFSPKRSTKRHRRTAAEIQACVDSVVLFIKKHKEGIGAQRIREALGLEAKEMPKILKTAIEAKLIRSKGQKRATTYSAR